jgi:hypothetical protein
VNAPEDFVGFFISAPSCPPAFDDAIVVTEDFEPW